MELLTPGTGLILWQLFVFVLLVVLLRALAWKPILGSLKERETSIKQALELAEKARLEMATLKADNEKLFKQAREERDKILKDARQAASLLHDQAQADAKKTADKIIDDARSVIQSEKVAALSEVKSQVAQFSLEIAERLIRRNLQGDAAQKELIQGYLKDIKLN